MKLEVGDVIQQPIYKNTWCLKIESVSGDGDEYNKETYYTDSEVELERIIRIIRTCRGSEVSEEAISSLKICGFEEDDIGIYEDLVGFDVTTQDIYRDIESVYVTYYDNEGAERVVLVNDKRSVIY